MPKYTRKKRGGHIVPYSLRNQWHSVRFIPLQIHTADCISNSFYLLGYCSRADAIYLALTTRKQGINDSTITRMLDLAYNGGYRMNHFQLFDENTTYQDIQQSFPPIPNRAYFAGYEYINDEDNDDFEAHAFVVYVGENENQDLYYLGIDPQNNFIYELEEYLYQSNIPIQYFSFILSDDISPGDNRVTRDIIDIAFNEQHENESISPELGPGANSQFHENRNVINYWSATSLNQENIVDWQNYEHHHDHEHSHEPAWEIDRWVSGNGRVWIHKGNHWASKGRGRRRQDYTQNLTDLLNMGMVAFYDNRDNQWQRFNGWRSGEDYMTDYQFKDSRHWWIQEWYDNDGLTWTEENDIWICENGNEINEDISLLGLNERYGMDTFLDNQGNQWQRFDGWNCENQWIDDPV